MLNTIAVTVLNWNRAELLEKTLSSFVHYHGDEAAQLHWIVCDNGSVDLSRKVIGEFELWRRKLLLDSNTGNAAGTSVLMQAFLETDCRYVLHLENDWECLRGGFLANCVQLLDSDQRVGMVRLSNKQYRQYNEVDGRPVEWSEPIGVGHDRFRLANCHYTFNPTLVKREVVEAVFPCRSERDAQGRFYSLRLLTAQTEEPKCFRHIGDRQKQPHAVHDTVSPWVK